MTNPSLLKALQVYNSTLEQLERSEDNVQKALEQLRRFAGSSTFNIDGKFYQLRKRKNSYYLCELSGKPKGRPKREVETPVVAEPAAPEEVLELAELALLERAEPEPEPVQAAVAVETAAVEVVEAVAKESTEGVALNGAAGGAVAHAE